MFAGNDTQNPLLQDRSRLVAQVIHSLGDRSRQEKIYANHEIEWATSAGVVMLLGVRPARIGRGSQPCVILNKRSLKVKQPGDLCFPGGRPAPGLIPFWHVYSRFRILLWVDGTTGAIGDLVMAGRPNPCRSSGPQVCGKALKK